MTQEQQDKATMSSIEETGNEELVEILRDDDRDLLTLLTEYSKDSDWNAAVHDALNIYERNDTFYELVTAIFDKNLKYLCKHFHPARKITRKLYKHNPDMFSDSDEEELPVNSPKLSKLRRKTRARASENQDLPKSQVALRDGCSNKTSQNNKSASDLSKISSHFNQSSNSCLKMYCLRLNSFPHNLIAGMPSELQADLSLVFIKVLNTADVIISDYLRKIDNCINQNTVSKFRKNPLRREFLNSIREMIRDRATPTYQGDEDFHKQSNVTDPNPSKVKVRNPSNVEVRNPHVRAVRNLFPDEALQDPRIDNFRNPLVRDIRNPHVRAVRNLFTDEVLQDPLIDSFRNPRSRQFQNQPFDNETLGDPHIDRYFQQPSNDIIDQNQVRAFLNLQDQDSLMPPLSPLRSPQNQNSLRISNAVLRETFISPSAEIGYLAAEISNLHNEDFRTIRRYPNPYFREDACSSDNQPPHSRDNETPRNDDDTNPVVRGHQNHHSNNMQDNPSHDIQNSLNIQSPSSGCIPIPPNRDNLNPHPNRDNLNPHPNRDNLNPHPNRDNLNRPFNGIQSLDMPFQIPRFILAQNSRVRNNPNSDIQNYRNGEIRAPRETFCGSSIDANFDIIFSVCDTLPKRLQILFGQTIPTPKLEKLWIPPNNQARIVQQESKKSVKNLESEYFKSDSENQTSVSDRLKLKQTLRKFKRHFNLILSFAKIISRLAVRGKDSWKINMRGLPEALRDANELNKKLRSLLQELNLCEIVSTDAERFKKDMTKALDWFVIIVGTLCILHRQGCFIFLN